MFSNLFIFGLKGYSETVNIKTNIGRVFLKLVRKHFPGSYKFNKI